jgi:hypothetical protein
MLTVVDIPGAVMRIILASNSWICPLDSKDSIVRQSASRDSAGIAVKTAGRALALRAARRRQLYRPMPQHLLIRGLKSTVVSLRPKADEACGAGVLPWASSLREGFMKPHINARLKTISGKEVRGTRIVRMSVISQFQQSCKRKQKGLFSNSEDRRHIASTNLEASTSHIPKRLSVQFRPIPPMLRRLRKRLFGAAAVESSAAYSRKEDAARLFPAVRANETIRVDEPSTAYGGSGHRFPVCSSPPIWQSELTVGWMRGTARSISTLRRYQECELTSQKRDHPATIQLAVAKHCQRTVASAGRHISAVEELITLSGASAHKSAGLAFG